MKSFKLYNGKRDKFSLRKKNVGLVSIAIATLALYGIVGGSQTTYAEEQNSTSGQVTSVSAPTEDAKTEKVSTTTSSTVTEASSASSFSRVENTSVSSTQTASEFQNSSTESAPSENSSMSSDGSLSTNGESSKSAKTPNIEGTTPENTAPKSDETIVESTIPKTRAARTRRSVAESSSHISNFSVTVTTKDGTVMNAGDTKTLPAQEVSFEKVQMTFKIKQDGTLKAGDKIRIPVKLENNAYAAYYANLGSGTAETIPGVGTIKFDFSKKDDLAYEITLNSEFASLSKGQEKTVNVNFSAANGAKFTAQKSKNNIVLNINGSTFTFKPVQRTFPKSEGNFAVYNGASSDAANSIKIGTSTGDANYYNNMLSSDGQTPGNTNIPKGDIITIHRIKLENGSKIIKIKPEPHRITSTLAISEDGKYLVKNDTSTSIPITNENENKLITLPPKSTDADILKALKKAGKNSSVVIDNGDGTYTIATNLGKMIGEGATTYHDIHPADDYGTFGDRYQEIDRTDVVNAKVNSILAKTSAIQGTGHSTRLMFADSSINNTITGNSKSYSVNDDGTENEIKSEKISATTKPSNARSQGQTKITVQYVDTAGNQIATQNYQYGYPGGTLHTQSPNYTAKPQNIPGYTLVTTPKSIPSIQGTQLTGNQSIAFNSSDQVFYYVYTVNKSNAKVTYIDDDDNHKVLETKELTGDYNTTDPYRTTETIKKYTDKNYELVSDNYPADGVKYNDKLQTFEVHLKHKVKTETQTKTVKETIKYIYAKDGATAAPTYTTELKFTRTATTDLVTNVTTGDWTAENGTSFAAVTSPAIKGHTPDLAEVPAVDNITANSANIEKTVVYTANQEKAQVRYIDDTTGATLETKELTGDYNTTDAYRTTETIKKYTDKNYELVSDNYPSNGVTYNTTYQKFEVHLRHKTAPVEETKTVTETIKYVYENGDQAATPKVQKLDFKRTNTKDLVTGKISQEGVWAPSTGTFSEVVSPTVDGYTPDKSKVDAVTITAAHSDIHVTVTYKADKQKVTYTIIDDTAHKTLKDKEVLTSGDSDTPLSDSARAKYDSIVNAYLAQGYELVSKDPLPAKFDLDSSHDQNVTVHLKHGTTNIQETKKVSLTVRYHGAGSQTPANNVQTATWTRTVTKDKITGTEVSATAWTSDKANYDAVPSPVIPGYRVDVATVPSETVTQEDIVKDVHYTIQTQRVTYTVVDDTTGTTLENQVELTTGESDAALPAAAQRKYDTVVSAYLVQGYELVSKDPLPAKFDLDSSHDQNVTVHLKHKVTTSSEIKTVKETIHYVYKNGSQASPSRSTSLTFTREVKTDEVTKRSTKGAWSPVTGTFTAVTSPTITGYTADKPIVAAVEGITGDSDDIEKTVVYTANQEKAQVRYIDDTTGATLETKELTGDYNTTDAYRTTETIKKYTDKNYELVSDNYPSNGVTYNTTYQKFEVHLRHKTAPVEETKTVTETIKYVYENGDQAATPKVQKLDFKRTNTKDLVTGKISQEGVWAPSTGTFSEVVSPTVDGYTPDKSKVDAVTITAAHSDIHVTVTYKADKQKVTYTIIDDTAHKTLKDKEVLTSGDSDTPLSDSARAKYDSIVNAYLAQGYELVSKDPLPAKFDLDSSHDQNVTVHLKHGTTNIQETKKVSLTVRYHGAGSQTPANNVQTATWTRTVTKDKITGTEVSATAWTSDKANYDAVPSPVIPGYRVDVATVPSETVTQEDIVKDVHYTIQTQRVTYTVVDDTTGTTLENQVELTTGESDAALPAAAQRKYDTVVSAYLVQGYELVSKDPLPAKFDLDSSHDQNVTVHLKHKVTTSSEIKTVKETIHYVYKNGSQASPSRSTSLTFTREVKTDEVTKRSTKGAWSPVTGTFTAVTSPTITGYTADKPIVAAVEGITGDSDDIEKTVVYTANQEKAQVRYIDDTTGATLETKELTGDYNTTDAYRTTETIKKYTDKNYELVSDNYPSNGVTYNTTYQKFEVHLRHKTAPVEETKTVTETIKYVYENGDQAATPKVQKLDFKRTNTKDLVTGKISQEGVWAPSTGTFSEVVSPTVDGYTPDKSKVDAVTITAAHSDIHVTVTYKADKQKVTYTIIDDTAHKTLKDKEVLTSGDSDTPLSDSARAKYDSIVNAYLAQGYELVSKDPLPAKFDLDSSHDQNVTVHLKHGTTNIQETKKVSLTVRYHGAGSQTPANNVQTATWTRTVTKDKITGTEVSATAWTSDKANYDAVPSPVIPGYRVDVATVPSETVTQEDIVKDVHYTIQTQRVTYTVVDDTTGTTLENQVELTTGESDAALPAAAQRKYDTVVSAYLVQGYELVSKDPLPAKFDLDSSHDQNVTVHLKHKVTTSSEIKTVKETIHYVYKNGSQASPSRSTSLTFTREVKTDEVTKRSTKGAWSPVTGTFTAVTSPTITGYTADKPIVAAVEGITGDSDDIEKTVVYTANQEKAQVRYIDDTTGETLETKELTGDYNTTDAYRTAETIKKYTDKNYELVSDNYPSNGVTYDTTYQKFEVHLRHKTAPVEETKTVTETIKYVYENGDQAATPKVQKLDFKRTNTKDLVTGKISQEGVWAPSTGTFSEVVSPTVDGYTPDKSKVDAVTITAAHSDIHVTVTYKADKQKVTYTIIDDTAHKTLKDKEVLTSGDSDTPLSDSARAKYDSIVNAYLAQGYELVSKDPLPAKFDLDSSHDQNVTVHLKHGTTNIQETKKVSLTVRYHGAGSQTPANNVQTATWTRTVTKDKITGTEVSATAWTSDKANYDAVPSPVIPGYRVDVATVPSETVTQEDIVKDVHYTANPVTPDKPTPPVVPSVSDKPTPPTLTVVQTLPTKPAPAKEKFLPSTGDVQDGSTLTMLTGIGLLLSALGLVGRCKKED